MADAVGNVLNPPGTSGVSEVKSDDILASMNAYTQKGVTLKGGQGLLAAGTAIARETASKKYVAYNNGGSGGAEVCKGFLRQASDTGPSGSPVDRLGNIVVAGILKYDKLVGRDSNADSDLNARVDSDNNLYIF